MSEFMEKHSVARLIGAPPGYVGYEEGGYLTEAVRRKPYCVILLDEIEKAHPDVFNVLLQVLDDGRMTDGQGRTVDFKNTVIVMTSNLGSHKIQQMTDDGADQALIKIAVMAEVKTHFRPEFVNRIDEIVVFHPLDEAQIAAIARIQLKALEARLREARDPARRSSDAALKAVAAGGLRSGLRRAAAEARDPAADRESAGEGDPRRASTRPATRSRSAPPAARSRSRRQARARKRQRALSARRHRPGRVVTTGGARYVSPGSRIRASAASLSCALSSATLAWAVTMANSTLVVQPNANTPDIAIIGARMRHWCGSVFSA